VHIQNKMKKPENRLPLNQVVIVAEDGYAPEARAALAEIPKEEQMAFGARSVEIYDNLTEATEAIIEYGGRGEIALVCGDKTHQSPENRSLVPTDGLVKALATQKKSRMVLVSPHLDSKGDHVKHWKHNQFTYCPEELGKAAVSNTGMKYILRAATRPILPEWHK